MFPLVLHRDDHGRIERGGVAGEFAIHLAGKIDTSNQVLSKRVVRSAEANGLAAERKGGRRGNRMPPRDEKQIGAWRIGRVGTRIAVKNNLVTPHGGQYRCPLAKGLRIWRG